MDVVYSSLSFHLLQITFCILYEPRNYGYAPVEPSLVACDWRLRRYVLCPRKSRYIRCPSKVRSQWGSSPSFHEQVELSEVG